LKRQDLKISVGIREPLKHPTDERNGMNYSRFEKNELILRDELAIDRTLLANERTLMAYLRSGVALMVAGASMMHFSQEDWFWMVGAACIPIGLATGIVGLIRYRKMKIAMTSCIRKIADSGKPVGKDGTGQGT
jgi:putative membrane protein